MQNYIKKKIYAMLQHSHLDVEFPSHFSLPFSSRFLCKYINVVGARARANPIHSFNLGILFEYKMLPNAIRIATDPKVFLFYY